ncbi:MAG: dihydroneopterin triphosphate diphosphatase [Rhodocyclaceae bacterium]|jgi:dATP pyrophosphohydrolase|nr:dihydroneopterin triphosphate diphosphatase [Rhodocyclaceae bacterium]
MGDKRPESVLVVVHTPEMAILLLERVFPQGFWQSVTGSLEGDETPVETACRELREETGLASDPAQLVDWRLTNRYLIPPAWRHRYPAGTLHNTERVFSYPVERAFAPRLAPAEHRGARWMPWREALGLTPSWTNRDAIRLVAGRL